MFYHILYPLWDSFTAFNVFRYITFRSALAAIISFLIIVFFGDKLISLIRRETQGIVRRIAPERHKEKQGTPSMGGLIIIGTVCVSVALTGNFSNFNVILFMLTLISFGLLGFLDDFIKEAKKDGRGISSKIKLSGQLLISFLVSIYLYKSSYNEYFFLSSSIQEIPQSALILPFFKNYFFEMGWLYIPFAMVVLIGTSNAVNLTDGLDGLAIGLLIIALVTFTLINYITGHQNLSEYLLIPFSPKMGEISVVLSALVGASIGFLWFNSHPAQIFMGDTGSLALGAILGLSALVLKSEILLIIIGGVFVIETASVIIQVFSFKVFKRRVFKMSPIHHHFEMIGWHENKIITRFWIVGVMCAMMALSLYKLR